MANETLNQLIKKLALDAVRTSKPCDIVKGVLTSEKPIRVRISEKVTLDSDFFYLTETAKRAGLNKGDEVAMIRAAGGQKYLVVDKVV